MDRVLILCEDKSFSSHIEKTLTQVGFEVAVQSHAKDLKNLVEVFSPQMIIVKGESDELSTLKVGQQLRFPLKFNGKVILIFSKKEMITPDEINSVKMDFVLFEPVGALKVVTQVLNLMSEHKEVVKQKLLKLAESDDSFKKQEEKLIISAGKSYEQEVLRFSGKNDFKDSKLIVKSNDELNDEERLKIKEKFEKDLLLANQNAEARIEKYNQEIKKIDIDLKTGLKKRHTNDEQKKLRKELFVDPGLEKLESLDQEKIKFAEALFKKSNSQK